MDSTECEGVYEDQVRPYGMCEPTSRLKPFIICLLDKISDQESPLNQVEELPTTSPPVVYRAAGWDVTPIETNELTADREGSIHCMNMRVRMHC